MPTFKITDPKTGQSFRVTGDSAPEENEISEIFGTMTKKADEGSLIKGLGTTITKERAQDLLKSDVPGKTSFAQRIGATGEPELRTPFGLPEQPAAFATGVAESASLGTANLLPGFKREKEMAEKFPKTKAAGEIAGAFIPGSGTAGAFKLGTKGAAKLIPKAAPLVQKAVGAGIGGAITGGIRGTVEEGGFDPVEGVKTGVKEGVTSALLTAGFEKLAPVLKKKAANFMESVLKPKLKFKTQGFEAEDIFKLKVDGTVNQTIKKASEKSNSLTKDVDNIVNKFVKANPEKKIFSNQLFVDTIDEISSGKGKGILANELKTASKEVKNIFEGLQQTGKLGELNAAGLRDLKKELGKIAFKKTPQLTDDDVVKRKAAKLIWQKIAGAFEDFVPEAAEKSKDIRKLILIQDVAEDAAKRIGKKNTISLRDMMIIAGSGGTIPLAGPVGPIAALAGVGTKKALETGRGGQLIRATGEAVQKPAVQRGTARATTKLLDLFKPPEERKQTGSVGRNF
jgi:hypothetical protein